MIDIKRIIDARGLDIATVSTLLFPQNKFPLAALKRVASGASELTSTQLKVFAHFAGLTVEELYSDRAWKMKSTDGLFTFESEDYIAYLNTHDFSLDVFYKKKLASSKHIMQTNITLSEFLNMLNTEVCKLK